MVRKMLTFRLNKYTDVFEADDELILYSYITKKHISIKKDQLDGNVITIPDQDVKHYLGMHIIENQTIGSYEEYQVLRDMARYSHSLLDVILHLNYDCNLRCPYCYQNNVDKNAIMTEETINKVCEQIVFLIAQGQYHELSLTLIGGEPTLHPRIVHEVSDKLSSLSCPISGIVVCNGTSLSDQLIEDCRRLGSFTFDITLDGAQDYHDQLRFYPNGQGSYHEIMSNIRYIQNKYPNEKITINCNLSKKNISGIKGLCDDLQSFHFNGRLIFSEVFSSPHSSYEEILNRRNSEWYEAIKIAERYGFVNDAFLRTSHLGCGMYHSDAYFIDPFGQLFSCINAIGNSAFRQTSFTNYEESSFDFARSQRIESDGLLTKHCRDCKFLPVCEGGCTYLNEEVQKWCPRWSFEHNERRVLKEHLLEGVE